MKQLFILFTTFSSLLIQGQEIRSTKKINKILIGYNFSPDYNYRTLKNNDGSSSSDIVIKSRNDIEIPKFGFTTGLHVWINFTNIIGLETGIQFSNKGYKTKNQDLIYFPPNPGLPTKAKTVYTYQYIGIPLKAKFTVGKSKTRFLSSIGIMTNFLLHVKQTTTFEYADGKTEEKKQSATSGFKKVDLSPMISVGIDYKLTDKIHLIAEPVFKYGVIKTKDAPVKEYLWNAGLNMAFYYGFK